MKYLILSILFVSFNAYGVNVSWEHPTEREQCLKWTNNECVTYQPLAAEEIKGYISEIYINNRWLGLNPGNPWKVTNMFVSDMYKYRLKTVDIDNNVSVPSVVFYVNPDPNQPTIICQ